MVRGGSRQFSSITAAHRACRASTGSMALGPEFQKRGWVFFGPFRRGKALSESAGPYIGDQIEAAKKQGGIPAGAATMAHLLETDHLHDELNARIWLRKQLAAEPCVVGCNEDSRQALDAQNLSGLWQFVRRRAYARILWCLDLDAGCAAVPRAVLHRSRSLRFQPSTPKSAARPNIPKIRTTQMMNGANTIRTAP